MKWLAKAALQKLFSALPGGERVNYLFQRHVARTLPWGREITLDKFRHALKHHRAYATHAQAARGPRNAYEFGCGREFIVPMSLYMLGVEEQTLVDLRPLFRPLLVNQAAGHLRQARDELAAACGMPLRPLPPGPFASLEDLGRALGIRYLAPCDARATGLPGQAFDLVSSTQVLEHVPAGDIAPLLRECARLASPQGVISLEVDMQDHHSYFDPSLSEYHFLTLGRLAWSLVNSGLQYQNRSRLPDYLAAVHEAGLTILAQEITWPSDQDLALLERLPVVPELRRRHSPNDLGARRFHLVCRALRPTG